jgi:DNA-binding CsgD family transcriptional regulator
MGQFTAAEVSGIARFAASAPIGTPHDPLPRPTLVALRDLIGADDAEYFELRRADRAVLASSRSDDEVEPAPGSEEAMHAFGWQNPLNWRRWSPADGAMRLSGRIGRRELARLEFYDGFMRPNELRDSLKIWLWASAESAACIQLWRRDSDFTRRTQAILAILHHHLINLRAEALTIPSEFHAAGPMLTAREAEVLVLACRGASDESIAERLGMSEATVGKHLEHAYDALGVHSRSEALWRLFGAAGSVPTTRMPGP